MNVSDYNLFTICGWIGIGVQKRNAAIRSFLVAMRRDRAELPGERRIRSGLSLVIARLDEVKEVIVRPMACFDDCAPFRVPGNAIRIARAFGKNLKLARARMHPPH